MTHYLDDGDYSENPLRRLNCLLMEIRDELAGRIATYFYFGERDPNVMLDPDKIPSNSERLEEKARLAWENHSRLYSKCIVALQYAEQLSANPLVFDAYVALNAVVDVLCSHQSDFDDKEDGPRSAIRGLRRVKREARRITETPLLLAHMKVQIADGKQTNGLDLLYGQWTRVRQPKEWRRIFSKLWDMPSLSHSTFKRKIHGMEIKRGSIRSWQFKIKQMPEGYIDDRRGYASTK